MSKTVEKIVLKNFKAFRSEQVIDFKNKNVLIYGNNGAGKSSIFWALYTFLQSSIKTKENVEKYFKVFNVADTTTHQSLRNVFEADDQTSYIELHVREDGALRTYKIPSIESAGVAAEIATPAPAESATLESVEAIATEPTPPTEIVTIETEVSPAVVEVPIDLSPIEPVASTIPPIDTTVKELNTTSDFINYKLLSGFYSSSHKYDVNLWNVFERDIFPFITDNVNDKTFLDKIIENTEDVERYAVTGYKLREGWRKEEYIEWIESDVNGIIDA